MTERLDIRGYRGEAVRNSLWLAPKETRQLGILLPGLRYGAQAPAMYYTRSLLLEHNADVLQLEYLYSEDNRFASATDEEQVKWISDDACAAFEAGLARRSYERVTVVGKSLGTLGMGSLVESGLSERAHDCVWMTPILSNPWLRRQIGSCKLHGLVVIGDADPYYDEGVLEALERETGNPTLILPGADHGLDIAGRVVESVRAIQYIVQALDTFLWA